MVIGGVFFYIYVWNVVFFVGLDNIGIIVVLGDSFIVLGLGEGVFFIIVLDSDMFVNIDIIELQVFEGLVFGLSFLEIQFICNGDSDGSLIVQIMLDGVVQFNFGLGFIFFWNIGDFI